MSPALLPDEGLAERAAHRHHVVLAPGRGLLGDRHDPERRLVAVREPEGHHGAVGETGRRLQRAGLGEQPFELLDALVHPGQVGLALQLDGRVAAVTEIGVVGVLARELLRQLVALLARPRQLLFETITRRGARIGRFRHRFFHPFCTGRGTIIWSRCR